jgi:hypothetical protein
MNLRRGHTLQLIALAGILLALAATPVPAAVGDVGDALVFTFDENGNGFINVNGTGFVPLQGALAPDPSHSGFAMALTYFLPTAAGLVGNGDVEISNATEGLGDVIRFTDAAGNLNGGTANRLIYYSDTRLGDPADSLADTPSPPINLGSGALAFATEVGPEGNNSFTYLATPNVYIGVSDGSVPEPGSLILLGTVLLGVAWKVGRRSRCA